MRIIRSVQTNTVHIIDPSNTIEEVVDKWKCNGNPDIIVHLYAKPLVSQTDGSHDFSDKSSPPFEGGLKVREPSGIFGKDLVME